MLGAKAKVAASFKPKKSQGFVLLTLIGGLCFGGAALFFAWYEHRLTWLPSCLCLTLLVASFVSWLLSHKNADLEGSAPTVIEDKKTGVSFQTDTRLLLSYPNKMQDWVAFFTLLANKQPLPSASGVIDSAGNIVPGSEGAANTNVSQINDKSKELTMQAIESLANRKANPSAVDDSGGGKK